MDFAELVGFVDDDEMARGRSLRGFRILGTGEDLEQLVRRQRIDEVVLAIDDVPLEFLAKLESRLGAMDVVATRWLVGLEHLGEEAPASREPGLPAG